MKFPHLKILSAIGRYVNRISTFQRRFQHKDLVEAR